MDTDITLTAYYTGPYYQLTVTSSPITGIPFTINGVSKTTTYTEWLLQGSYTVEMPATYSGYTWSHWLEDGDTNRIKTFTLSSTKTLTAIYTTAPPPPTDITPPAAVTDLRVSGITTHSITLTWTAPGDDGNIGTASQYDVRYSTSPITETNWGSATQALGEPTPSVAGSTENFMVTGLSPGTTYYFALKTADEVPNWSELSNVASGPNLIPGRDVPAEAPDFFTSVLSKLNIPISQFAVQALTIWTNYEDTGAYWNPLATTWDMGEKSWDFNEAGVKNYVDKETGFQATANTLALHYYESIREMLALQSFNEQGLREAVATWSGLTPADPYVVNLVNEWRNIYDIYWLAKAIMSEASVGTREEQVAVGWTVINRLDSHRYGNSIEHIVKTWYAYDQEPTEEIKALAKDLLERKILDPTDGATHFFSPRKMQLGPRVYGPYKISGTDESVLIPYWAIPEGYSEASPPPPEWQITPFYRTIDTPTTEWISGLGNIRNWYFMFYRPYITRIHAEIGSPSELRVYDSQGRVTGLVNGTVVIEIPESDYFENTVTIFFPNDTYRYEVVGTSEGSYGLTVTAVTRQENITFSAIGIPVSVEAIHQYSIDWVALSQGEEGATVQVDSNGDGVFEHIFTSDSELTQSEFLAQIALYTFPIVWGQETFIVSVESNSTVSNFVFNQPDKEISFNVTGLAGTIGFCNVTIPKALLYGEPWTVLIDGAPVPPTITENATHSSLYFTYTHSTHEVQIIGTWAIPPPPSPTYSLTITTTVGGTTDPAPGTYSYTANSTVQVTAIPDANYLFDHWELDTVNVGSANPYTVLMDNNHTLKAVFTYSPPPPSLSASISPLSTSILVGQSVTFTSAVSGGYTPYTYQWYLNGNPVSGATSSTWTFTPTTGGIYYVYLKVTDAKGNTAQSDAARITVATVPVGGYSISIQTPTKTEPILPYTTIITTITIALTKIRNKTKRKH
jgi:hypothetical protein